MKEAISARLAHQLIEQGYKKVSALKGGWYAWEDAEYPVQRKEETDSKTTE